MASSAADPAPALTCGSLFAGIGGMDLGLERAGMRCVWQVELNDFCRRVLAKHWPDVRRHDDVRTFVPPEGVDVLAGGDPCPVRSRARAGRPSSSPDLSGYFLALAAGLRPRWILRENVPAPDALCFAAGLECVGYRVASVALDSRDFTGQSRRRQFLVGCPPALFARFARVVFDAADGVGFVASRPSEATPVAACLTAHPSRMAAEDTYCFEPGRGLRTLDPVECESLQGFPRGWTAGFSRSRRRVMLGNAVTVPVAEWLGRHIVTVAREAPA